MGKSTKAWTIAVALLPLLLAAGCTGTDVLKPTTGNLKVSVEVVNIDPDGPFTDDPVGDPLNAIPADTGFIQVQQVTMRPTNPDADAALGLNLGVLRRPLEQSYTSPGADETSFDLTSATYRLAVVRLKEIFFYNSGPRNPGALFADVRPEHIDPNNPRCIDFVRVFGSEDLLDLSDFGGEILISTEADTPAELKIIIDGEAFLDAYTESWSCNPSQCRDGANVLSNCPAEYDPNDPATFSCQCFATVFNAVAFRNRVGEFLTIE